MSFDTDMALDSVKFNTRLDAAINGLKKRSVDGATKAQLIEDLAEAMEPFFDLGPDE